MGIGAITVSSPGSVTAPTTGVLPYTASAALTAVFKDFGAVDAVYLPSLRAVLFCDGMSFQYHVIDGAQYLNGPLAPGTAPDAASTSARASVVATPVLVPNDGDIIQIGKPGVTLNGAITFKTTLDPTLAVDQVKIGGSIANAIANLKAFVNGTGVQGTEFWSTRIATYGYSAPSWDTENDIRCSASSATTITLEALTYGTVGNSYLSIDVIPGTGARWAFASTRFTGGTAGTKANSDGTAPSSGAYQHAIARLRRQDNALTAISPTDTTLNGGNVDMTVSTYPAPPSRDGMTHTRIFRSVVNGGSVLYKVADTTSDPYTDSVPDTTLTGDFAFLYDSRNYRPFGGGYPPRFRYATLYRGCIFGTGAQVAAQASMGDVSITKGSTTATFANTRYKDDIIGRVIRCTGSSSDYIVANFVESTQIATLSQAFQEATVTNVAYTLTDARNPNEVYWTAANLYNNWPVANSEKGVTSEDPAGNTGIQAAWDSLVVFTRTGVWRLYGSPESGFRIVPQAEGMGAYTNQGVVNVEGALYWIGPDGIYAWGGEGAPQSLSNPPATNESAPRGIVGTLQQINPDAVDGIVAVHNPTERTVYWFVPLDGSPWNSHAIVLDLQTGAFTLDKVPAVTAAAAVVGPDGNYYTVIGDAFGNVFQYNVGNSDAAFGFNPVQAVSTYTASTRALAVSGTPFPTSSGGLAGVPVIHVSSTGSFQTEYVASNTSSTLTLVKPFATAPATSDTIILGGIEYRITSSKFDFAHPEERKTLTSITASYVPQTVTSQMWCAGGTDNNDPSVFLLRSSGAADYANLQNTDGEHLFWLRKGKGRRLQFDVVALCPGFDVNLLSLVPTVRTRDEVAS